jgi:hypothetical protein
MVNIREEFDRDETPNTPVPAGLDPVLNGVYETFHLQEKFKIFLDRNEHVKTTRPDVGFLLFLIEEQRTAILDLEVRVAKLEGDINASRKPLEYRQ